MIEIEDDIFTKEDMRYAIFNTSVINATSNLEAAPYDQPNFHDMHFGNIYCFCKSSSLSTSQKRSAPISILRNAEVVLNHLSYSSFLFCSQHLERQSQEKM